MKDVIKGLLSFTHSYGPPYEISHKLVRDAMHEMHVDMDAHNILNCEELNISAKNSSMLKNTWISQIKTIK